ncbi:MAG: AGE family epimerase/isomerase, partial [Tidjanibacter sp.]|nr:AGE family epimerase/isomerase [Tidjanibacter sp.]
MTNEQKQYLRECADLYRKELVEDVMPFWMKNGVDRKNGGIYTCVDRDGTLMDTTKSVWFQGRWGWTAAAAYNLVEKNEEWLQASKSAIDFIEKHCVDADGHMFFTVTAEGAPVQKRRYVFSESFAAIAMAEYAKATGSVEYAHKALEVFRAMKRMLSTPGFLEPKTTVQGRGHSITMILINVAAVLKEVIDAPELDEQIDSSINDIERYLMNEEYKTVLEMVGPEGELIDTCAGRTINPGHCIETAWFILAEAKRRGWDERLTRIGLTIFDWAWEWGWDNEYGGIINFRDCKGFPPQDYSQDMK